MEKKALVLLSLGLALGLASCGEGAAESTSSSTPEATASSSEVVEAPTSSEPAEAPVSSEPAETPTSSEVVENPGSSSEPAETPTSSEPVVPPTSSSEPATIPDSSSEPTTVEGTWDTETAAALDTITYGHVPPITAALLDAGAGLYYDSDLGVFFVSAEGVDYSLVTDWAALLEDNGYIDTTWYYLLAGIEILDGEVVLETEFDDGILGMIDIYFFDDDGNPASSGTGTIQALLSYSAPIYDFPAEDIADLLETYYGVTDVEIPAFEAAQYDLYQPSTDYPYIEVDGYVESDLTDEYATTLEAAGWVDQEYAGYNVYVDSTSAVCVEFGYSAEDAVFWVIIYGME